MAKMPMQMEGLELKIPSGKTVTSITGNGDTMTLTEDGIVVSIIIPHTATGDSHVYYTPPSGTAQSFSYPSPGKPAFGMMFLKSGTTLSLTVASGAQCVVAWFKVSEFFKV